MKGVYLFEQVQQRHSGPRLAILGKCAKRPGNRHVPFSACLPPEHIEMLPPLTKLRLLLDVGRNMLRHGTNGPISGAEKH
jgi:hypothetical protein